MYERVGSGMGDRSGSEDPGGRCAEGDDDTGHQGTPRGCDSTSRVLTCAVGGTSAQPAGTLPPVAWVSSCTARMPVQPTCGRV